LRLAQTAAAGGDQAVEFVDEDHRRRDLAGAGEQADDLLLALAIPFAEQVRALGGNFGPWYASVPGLIVIAPYSAADAKGLLKAAIRSEDPVVFLENELIYGQTFDVPKLDDYVLPIGKAKIVREGKDITLVSYSIGVGVALDAATQLAEQGIEADVIDLRTLRPLDRETVLKSLAKTNRLVCAEEGWPTCSISSEIMAICMEDGFDDLDAPVMRVTDVDVPLPYAANLEKLALIKVSDVVEAAKKVCYR